MGFVKLIIGMTLVINNVFNNIVVEEENDEEVVTENVIYEEKEYYEEEHKEDIVLDTYYGTVTSYTAYCEGCIGITASGYNVLDTIYYDDNTYGSLRVIAMDSSVPFGSIVRLSGFNNYPDVLAIVLDRGGAISFGGSSQVDLLFDDYDSAINFGRNYNVTIEILRYGY